MRVTTQMMHASAKRAGISLGGTSLLNYINKDNGHSSQNALLNALSTRQITGIDKTQAANYKKLESTANSLEESLQAFLTEGEESVWKNTGADTKGLADAVESLLKNYNNTVKSLKNASNPLNDFYKEMLVEAATESETDLSAIGVTQNEDGMLTIDENKWKNADLEAVKKALDGNSPFISKTAFIVSRISDNAKANTESYSSQYGADGYSYVTNSSRYDFWG